MDFPNSELSSKQSLAQIHQSNARVPKISDLPFTGDYPDQVVNNHFKMQQQQMHMQSHGQLLTGSLGGKPEHHHSSSNLIKMDTEAGPELLRRH